MKIKTGELEIFESGTVIGFKNNPIEFELSPQMKISIHFKNDEKIKDNKVNFNITENGILNIELINFNNSLGTGNTEPLPLGKLNKRELFFNYRVYSLTKDDFGKTLHYTWYLGKEVENG